MRRGILLIAACILMLPAFGQIMHGKEDKDFRVFDAGLVGGFNFSQVHGDALGGFNKVGINAGGIAHINFNSNWSLSFEVLYSQKGSATVPSANNVGGTEYKLAFQYAEVPVQINYNDKNRLIFSAGLAYGRLFSATEVINGLETPNIEEAMNSSEYSLLFGGTILVGETRHWGVNFRYQQSFIAVGPSAQSNVPGLVNVVISLRGIYYF